MIVIKMGKRKVKICVDCKNPIKNRSFNAVRCIPCAIEYRYDYNVKYQKKYRRENLQTINLKTQSCYG